LHVATTSDGAARGFVAATIPRAGQIRFRIATAAVSVIDAELTHDVTAASGLADLDARRAEGRAEATAATAAIATNGAFNPIAIGRDGNGGATSSNALATCNGADATAAIGSARADVSVLNAVRGPDCAEPVFAQAGAAVRIGGAAVSRGFATRVEGGACAVVALLPTAVPIRGAASTIGYALTCTAYCTRTVQIAAVRGRRAGSPVSLTVVELRNTYPRTGVAEPRAAVETTLACETKSGTSGGCCVAPRSIAAAGLTAAPRSIAARA